MIKTNYSKIAATYNSRYTTNYLVNIENEIKNLISFNNYKTVLEAGCGTGRWIKSLYNYPQNVFGLDYSLEMLKISKTDEPNLNILNANAICVPFKSKCVDLIFCVNAIHHFSNKEKFVNECRRVISDNGMLAVFGVDPHIDKHWYVYDYFDSVYENDLKRFPSLKLLKQLFEAEKFTNVQIKVVEEINNDIVGNDVFNDPFLQKNHCSQLANLSEEEYERGIAKIKNQIKQKPQTIFKTSVIFYLTTAKKK
jgi:SAM-dependent methyltransferase